LLEIAKCVGWAKQKHAQMIFLPENCGFMGAAPGETLQNAERPLGQEQPNTQTLQNMLLQTYEKAYQGEFQQNSHHPDTISIDKHNNNKDEEQTVSVSLVDGLRTLARASQMWMSIGGMHVLGAPPAPGDDDGKTRYYNTHVIVDNQGTIQAVYRKIHLFDVSIPGKVNLKESNSTAAGTKIVTCPNTPVGKIGLSTCYDMRFPELYQQLVKQGAETLLMPSAFTVPTGQAHWHVILRGMYPL
jgi:predicted amidohydrolase